MITLKRIFVDMTQFGLQCHWTWKFRYFFILYYKKERQKLENENITIKKQLKAAHEQIDCLKKEISSMRNDNLASHSQTFKVTSEL